MVAPVEGGWWSRVLGQEKPCRRTLSTIIVAQVLLEAAQRQRDLEQAAVLRRFLV